MIPWGEATLDFAQIGLTKAIEVIMTKNVFIYY